MDRRLHDRLPPLAPPTAPLANPLRSEEDAFRLTLFVAVFALPIIVAALVFSPSVALGVLGGLCYAGIFVWARARRAQAAGKPEADDSDK